MSLFTLPENISESDNKKLRHDFTVQLSRKIREARKAKRLTQQELAEKSGLHLTYIGHLELGKYHPTAFVLWKIAKALDVPPSDLFDF